MVARKIEPGGGGRGDHGGTRGQSADRGRWRQPQAQPTRAPHGEVLWWQRAAPEASDPALWNAVQRIHIRRQQLGMSVSDLARRLTAAGRPMRRETLSRILNGKQPTTWDTAERLADVLGIGVEAGGDDPPPPPRPAP